MIRPTTAAVILAVIGTTLTAAEPITGKVVSVTEEVLPLDG